MYLEIAETIPSLVVALIMGPLSDIIGRKPALMTPLAGNIIKHLLILFMQIWDLPLYLVIVATGISGSFGGPATLIAAAYSYMADTATSDKRSLRMTILHTSFRCGSRGGTEGAAAPPPQLSVCFQKYAKFTHFCRELGSPPPPRKISGSAPEFLCVRSSRTNLYGLFYPICWFSLPIHSSGKYGYS